MRKGGGGRRGEVVRVDRGWRLGAGYEGLGVGIHLRGGGGGIHCGGGPECVGREYLWGQEG